MGIPFLLAALILNLNHTTWFTGEDGVETALWWVGGILVALQVIWFLFVLLVGVFATTRR